MGRSSKSRREDCESDTVLDEEQRHRHSRRDRRDKTERPRRDDKEETQRHSHHRRRSSKHSNQEEDGQKPRKKRTKDRGEVDKHRRDSSRKRHRSDSTDGRDDRKKKKKSKDDRRSKSKNRQVEGDDDKQPVIATKTPLCVDPTKLFNLGDRRGHPPELLLEEKSDYFAYHKHLWLYLYRERSTAFNDLSSEEARVAFSDFVLRYNSGDLAAGYYSTSLPVEALEECQTTRHSWNLKISDQEDKSLQVFQIGVHKQTEYQAASQTVDHAQSTSTTDKARMPPPGAPQQRSIVEQTNKSDSSNHYYQSQNNYTNRKTSDQWQAERVANQRVREHAQTVQEELGGGRKEGRERQIEKRKERSDRIHGASGASREETELNDDALYGVGGESSDYSRALASSQQRAANNTARKQARVQELQQKEQERQTAMLESLGLSHKIGQKIQIQPRNDAG